MQSRIENAQPVAIIGVGCRFPGATSPEAFWQLLAAGTNAVRTTPPERWSLERFYNPDPRVPGKLVTQRGGFIDNIDRFDAQFFGISPREAAYLDPQQRVLLELTWEALEDAGIVPATMSGRNVGVFMGAFTLDYMLMQMSDRPRIETHTATGSMMTMVSNRISYTYDFRGPSLSVDTACSSSLVAVHLACRSLEAGECRLALAGGVNVIMKPEHSIAESKGGFLSPDGASKAFSRSANGYVRGEGAGVVVLKLLEDAVADGDPVYAIIRGTAVNQDGHSNGITVPRQQAQEEIIRQACGRALLSPADIHYVEAHGTGTPVGDPIEARALGNVMSQGRPAGSSCIIGSAKTNIGHLEAAAGIAGLIKAALCLKHRRIPPSLYSDDLNPAIPFQELSLRIPQSLEEWPATEWPARAGVNSFGFGGTNAHAILEEASRHATKDPSTQEEPSVQETPCEGRPSPVWDRPILMPLSARTPEALTAAVRNFDEFLATSPGLSLRDAAYTAALRRTHHPSRLAVLGSSPEEMRTRLQAWLAGEARPGLASGVHSVQETPGLVFVFSGMGPQWWAMGRQLYEREPVFREVVDACDEEFRRQAGWSILEQMRADECASRMTETEVAQPANFVLQAALSDLLRSWGVVPGAIAGHSVGEVSAAYVSGALSLEDAIRVSYHRSRLQQTAAGRGAMMAVSAPLEQVQKWLTGYKGRIAIAAVNSRSATTVSGDPEALDRLAKALHAENVLCRPLRVNVAYHSHHMDALRDELLACLVSLRPKAASTTLYSTVTGGRIDGGEMGAHYWWENVRKPVLFQAAAEALIGEGYTMYLEVGPHPVLGGSISECLSAIGTKASVHYSLRRGEDESERILTALAELHCNGYPIAWDSLYARGNLVKLPAYPWQRERHWAEGVQHERDRLGVKVHPLLGDRTGSPLPSWRLGLNRHALPLLDDHRVHGAVVYPGAGYIEMALAAVRETYGTTAVNLESITFSKALFLAQAEGCEIETVIHPEQAAFQIYSRANPESGWSIHAAGKLHQRQDPESIRISLDSIRRDCPLEVDREQCYRHFAERGFTYGPAFQRIQRIQVGPREALSEIEEAADIDDGYIFHPSILDACFQTLIALDPFRSPEGATSAYLPVGLDRVRLYRKPSGRMYAYARITEENRETAAGDILLAGEDGNVIAEVHGFRVQVLEGAQAGPNAEQLDRWVYQLEWTRCEYGAEPDSRPENTNRRSGPWLIFEDSGGIGSSLAAMLEQRGERCVRVVPAKDYAQVEADRFVIDPECPEHYAQLLEGVSRLRAGVPGFSGIVHMWSLNVPLTPRLNSEALRAAQSTGCLSAFHLVKALAASMKPGRLWLVTRGAQHVIPEQSETAVAQAPVWGLGRVAGHQEHAGLWGGLIDLDPDAPAPDSQAGLLIEDLLGVQPEDQVAYRAGKRYGPRLVHGHSLQPSMPARFRPDGTYLITGGFGALGLLTAQWMVERGARRLVLLGRSKMPPRLEWTRVSDPVMASRIAAIRGLESRGATVYVADADVADESSVVSFYRRFRKEGWPAIRGVVYAAGVVRDQLLHQMDQRTFEDVLRPKMVGAWVLHRLLERSPLDFFVMYSSTGSLVVSAGQANYAAGNAFLDSLAHYRRSRGLPALSVNWGPWAVGMVRDLGLQDHYARLGLDTITPQCGMGILDRLIGQDLAQAVVVSSNWPVLFETRQPVPLMLAHLGRQGEAVASCENAAGPNIVEAIALADQEERASMIANHVRDLAARVLRLDPARLDLQQPLNALGLDSMMATELKTRIELSLEVSVPVLDLLKGSSIADLSKPVMDQMAERAEVMAQVLAEVEASHPA